MYFDVYMPTSKKKEISNHDLKLIEQFGKYQFCVHFTIKL